MHGEILKKEVIIIGGGVAGLTAAVEAIKWGFRPIILEKSRYLGGRARSFYATDIQQTVDNGQHILSAGYSDTIQLLKKIGSIHKINFQKNLHLLFVNAPGRYFRFHTLPLPAPFHFFIPLILNKKYTGTNLGEYVGFIRENFRLSSDQLKKLTVESWLNHCGQKQHVRELLWKPLTHSILNTNPRDASAFLLRKALSQSFLHSAKRARLGLPRDWLGEIFAQPAERFIRSGGGSIYRKTSVIRMLIRENHIDGLVTNQHQLDTPWVISAVPPYALQRILDDSETERFTPLSRALTEFEYNTIITINIFLNRPLPLRFPVSMVSSPLQWIFSLPKQKTATRQYGYALVMSAANEWSRVPSGEILKMVQEEFLRLLGLNLQNKYRILNCKIIKEKRATISQTPHSLSLRPGVDSGIDNLFWAGDWINTGLPATIESAVHSGRLAMEKLMDRIT